MATSHKAWRLAEATVKAWRKLFNKQQQESTGRIVTVQSEGVPLVQMIGRGVRLDSLPAVELSGGQVRMVGRGKLINPHQMPVELSAGYTLDIAELSIGGALVVDKVTLADFLASGHPAAEAHRQRVAMIRLRESLDKRLMAMRTGRGWLFYRKERVIDSGMGCLSHVKQLVTPATHIPANKRPRGKAYRRALDREVAVGWYAPQPRHEDSL